MAARHIVIKAPGIKPRASTGKPVEAQHHTRILAADDGRGVLPTTAPHNEDFAKASNDRRLRDLDTRLIETHERLQEIRAQQGELLQRHERLQEIVAELAERFHRPANSPDHDDTRVSSGLLSDKEREQQMVSSLDEQLARQSLDPQWSQEAAGEFGAIISTEAFSATTLLNAECKSTLCRTEFAHADRAALEQFFDRFPNALAGNRSAYYQTIDNPDGSVDTVVYVSRHGHELPLNAEPPEQ